jgi:RNA-dependent RNA polymerase
MIQEVLQFDTCPTAVQGRVAGAKGVWSQIRPTADADSLASKLHACRDPALFITESQKKSWVNFSGSTPLARAHRIFCLVKPAKVSTSVTLNKQSILCLWWGMMKQAKRHAAASESQPDYSVLEKLFTDTVRDGLRTTLYPFTNFDKPDSVLLLWNAVERAGGLTATRVRHVLAGHSRAQGWGQKFDKDEEDEDTPSGFDRRAYSGSPVSIHMTVLEMLLNGFHPKTCPKLHSDIIAIIKLVAANFLKDYHLPITDAIEAMFIPGEQTSK